MVNVLSLSRNSGLSSDLIPLFVLNQRYFKRMPEINNTLLLPNKFHKQYKDLGIAVLPIDFSVFDGIELIRRGAPQGSFSNYSRYVSNFNSAIEMSKADVIIEDNEIIGALAEKNGIARISIFRTGLLGNVIHSRNPAHMHSVEKTASGSRFDSSFFLRPDTKLSHLQKKVLKATYLREDIDYYVNYLKSGTKLIPGIPSIEKIPDNLENRKSFFYTGPLIIEDTPADNSVDSINQFIHLNRDRKVVFIYTDIDNQDYIKAIARHLLQRGYAVITSSTVPDVDKYKDRFLNYLTTSYNFICSKVDLIIHHCGSDIYYYPLLHGKPVITIGTQCYDREEIAMQLQQANLSRHVPSVKDDWNYLKILDSHIHAFENDELCNVVQLSKIRDEIYQTMIDFDMDAVIDYTLHTSA